MRRISSEQGKTILCHRHIFRTCTLRDNRSICMAW